MSNKSDSECDVVTEDEIEEGEISDKITQDVRKKRKGKRKENSKFFKYLNGGNSLTHNSISAKCYRKPRNPDIYCNLPNMNNIQINLAATLSVPQPKFKTVNGNIKQLLNECDTKITASVNNESWESFEENKCIDVKSKHISVASQWSGIKNNTRSITKLAVKKKGNHLRNKTGKRSASNDIDADASFEELLEKYKSIQKELATLDKEEKDVLMLDNQLQCTSFLIDNQVQSNALPVHDSFQLHVLDNLASQSESSSSGATTVICKTALNHDVRKLEDSEESKVLEGSKSEPILLEGKDDSLEADLELRELRLQALASCARSDWKYAPSLMEIDKTAISNIYSSETSSFSSLEVQSESLDQETFMNNENSSVGKAGSAFSVAKCTDNYDVLDMEIDDVDDKQSYDIVIEQNNKLVSNFKENSQTKVALKINTYSTESLESRNYTNDSREKSSIDKISSIDESICLDTRKNSLGSNIVASEKIIHKQEVKYSHCSKTVLSKNCTPLSYPKQAPVVINLGEDSSSEEDSDEKQYTERKVVFANLMKLIDSAKNNSYAVDTSVTKVIDNIPLVPKDAVNAQFSSKPTVHTVLCSESSLPNVQPEEYQKIGKLLSQNKSLKEENTNIGSWKIYTLLMNKLDKVKSMINLQNRMLKIKKTRSNVKKAAFITSQVEVQRLQEQLIAAIKVRDVNKTLMFEANSQLRNIQNSVSKSNQIIKELQMQHSKLGKQIFGENYSYSVLSTGDQTT